MDEKTLKKIEAAIIERHGEDAVQDPADFWTTEQEERYKEQYKRRKNEEDREERCKQAENVYIAKKLITQESKADILFRKCKKCNNESKRDIDDDTCFTKYDCCYKCYIRNIEPIEQRKRAEEELLRETNNEQKNNEEK